MMAKGTRDEDGHRLIAGGDLLDDRTRRPRQCHPGKEPEQKDGRCNESRDERKESIFLAAGAHGFVTKDPGDPWGTLKRVAAII